MARKTQTRQTPKFDAKKFVFHDIRLDDRHVKMFQTALSDAPDELFVALDNVLQSADETKISLRWDDGGFYLCSLIRHNSAITARAGSATEAMLLAVFKLQQFCKGIWPDAALMHASVWG